MKPRTIRTYTGVIKPQRFLLWAFRVFPFPDGLVPGVTYYWRIDEITLKERFTKVMFGAFWYLPK